MTSFVNKSVETNKAEDVNPYDSSVNNLSKGILGIYSPPLVNVQKQLEELSLKQTFLITQMHNENLHLAEVRHSPEIQEMFNMLKMYHMKLLNIKKDMKLVYKRSLKLKKRALHLQQAKEKEKQIKIESENKLKQEQNLIGQPGSSSSSYNVLS
ncbi:hypothetical protein NQ314_017144 [Rhamnusium bicolor]|uniref:Biogenesis of lysosome-related organelles complex 1 subunit 6 n=1 Tax=Rhamnusium bicolor TaxID=1586634 RepID=A0AAV8WTM0_9CUCU|nr:hypothetical protein NQ314_017144 [Rhamnusium bicolor]